MKKVGISAVLLSVFFSINIYAAYSQDTSCPADAAAKTYDVNNDGSPDVSYYSDGKYVTKAEADTNYDGKPDVIVHTKDGKFYSAEVDTDYDGKVDKKFNDVSAFNQWLNENKSDFNDTLNRPDWQFDLARF